MLVVELKRQGHMGAEKPRLRKNWILKNLDLDNEKCGKQVDAEK